MRKLILAGMILALALLIGGVLLTFAPPEGEIALAVVQFQPSDSKEENLRRIEGYLRQAGERSADLVLFPELATAFYPQADLTGALNYYRANAEPIPGPTTQLMARLAAEYGMYISWGMAELSGEKLYNSQVLVGPEGVVGVYRKIHLVPGLEEAIFTPGERLEVYDTALGKVAIMICFDRRFPELARTYSLMGAEIILIAAATPDRAVDQHILATRAYENSVWLLFANQAGPGMHGESRIVDPTGRTRVQAGGSGERILLLSLRRSELEKDWSLLERRRPEVYAEVPVFYPTTKEGVIDFVVAVVLHYRTEGKELYITPEPLPRGTVVRSWTREVRRLPAPEWLVFIDDFPTANWEHPCRYVFVDATTWRYVVIEEESPPRNLELERVSSITPLSLPSLP